MAITMNVERRLDKRRAAVVAKLMPDTCTIYPILRTRNSEGAWEDELGAPLLYSDSSAIPCRMDPTRYYRDDRIFGQEITINTYSLVLPYDVGLTGDMRIDFQGRRFEVRELFVGQSWALVTKAIVAELSPDVIP